MKLKLLSSVDSTNNYLRRLAESEGVEEGTAVVSLEQTSGRGQRGNSWASEVGLGLYFSILLRPSDCSAEGPFLLNKVIAAAAARYVETAAGCRVSIRWPNDLLIGGRKAGGLLIENTWRGSRLGEVIAGVGINLNQQEFRGDFRTPPVSLGQLTGKSFDPIEEAGVLQEKLLSAYDSWRYDPDTGVVEYYTMRLHGRGGMVRFLTAAGDFVDALFSGVDEQGRAVIIENGTEKRVSHPEFRIHAVSGE